MNFKNYFAAFLIAVTLVACKDEPETQTVYEANQIHTIPYGGEGTITSGDYTGQGTATNTAGTLVTIDGVVTVDAISASGKLSVPAGSVLVVNSVLNIGGGATIDVKGILITKDFTMVGNTYVSNGKIEVNGKFTIGGGTTLYLENSLILANELVIIGHVQALDNAITQAANWYSMIKLTGAQYLNRGGGTTVCGPVLFNVNTDQGASGVEMKDVTDEAIANNSGLKTLYGLPADAKLYQYGGTCTALTVMPAH